MTEVSGGNAILVNPYRAEDIGDAMMEMAADDTLRIKLSEDGIAWSKRFLWDRIAEDYLKMIKGVIDRKSY